MSRVGKIEMEATWSGHHGSGIIFVFSWFFLPPAVTVFVDRSPMYPEFQNGLFKALPFI